ncbi:MAG: DNA-binding protein, partial [Candidatus Omnitrophica bacterium CG12_big_fil_rev_8_21_14_0_65_45_16]
MFEQAFKNIDDVLWKDPGSRIILDQDLARLYGVTTKRLNEQVKRNRSR